MNDKQIIRDAMQSRGYTQSLLAEKVGYASQAGIGQILSARNNTRLDTFVKLLNAMDFEVVVRSKTKSGEEWKVEM